MNIVSVNKWGGGLLIPFEGQLPKVAADVFVAHGAAIIGDVEVGSGSSIWYGCVLRGDVNNIRVGQNTNIQDQAVVHVTRRRHETSIGSNCTIGHGAIIHGCTLEEGSYIGMGSTVMDGAVIGQGAMVGAGALITEGKRVASGQLWLGCPAKFVRNLRTEESRYIKEAAHHYSILGQSYRDSLVGA